MNSQEKINTIVTGNNKYLKAGGLFQKFLINCNRLIRSYLQLGYIIAVLNLFKSIYEIYGSFELLAVINGPCEKFQNFLTEEDPDFDFPDENCELYAKGKNRQVLLDTLTDFCVSQFLTC